MRLHWEWKSPPTKIDCIVLWEIAGGNWDRLFNVFYFHFLMTYSLSIQFWTNSNCLNFETFTKIIICLCMDASWFTDVEDGGVDAPFLGVYASDPAFASQTFCRPQTPTPLSCGALNRPSYSAQESSAPFFGSPMIHYTPTLVSVFG